MWHIWCFKQQHTLSKIKAGSVINLSLRDLAMSSSIFRTFLYLIWSTVTVAAASYSSVLGLFAKSFQWTQRRFWVFGFLVHKASQDYDEQWLYPHCLYICVFAYASKVHSKDMCTQSLIDVCDNFPVGKHLHVHSVICGLFRLAKVQSWLAGFTENYVRQICLTGHSKILGAWLKTTLPSFHPLLAPVVSTLHHSFTHSFLHYFFAQWSFFAWLNNNVGERSISLGKEGHTDIHVAALLRMASRMPGGSVMCCMIILVVLLRN